MSIDLSQFRQAFIEESIEGLDIMEASLLRLEAGTPDLDEINNIFRAAHSIKGGSGTFGFDHVTSFTHILETLLDEVREGKRNVTETSKEYLLESVDCLKDMIGALQDDTNYDENRVTEVQEKLQHLLDAEGNTATPSPDKGANNQQQPVSVEGWHISFKPHAQMMQTGNDPLRMLRELADLGTMELKVITDDVPEFTDLEPEKVYLAWQITLHGNINKAEILDVFAWVEDECDLSVEAIPVQASNVSPVEPKQASTQPSQVRAKSTEKSSADSGAKKAVTESASIRVSIDKIDALINMVGELVITQSMLNQFGEVEEFDISMLEKLNAGLAQLERNTRELQESVMSIRMLPISFAFSRFPRMVHDVSQKMGKQVELKLSGEGTELDKTVMEKIGDPLVHLVRNAIDHGIEKPDARKAAGKPAQGEVSLNAYHQGGNIVIEIKDDGAGLDADRLLKKAIDKGLVKQDEQLSEQQIYDLIFMPGFSTAEVVSDISGRGVGMDVVRKNIISLGGNIEIDSRLGKGTTFRIRLPLTLAILDGQTVRVGDEVYIIPLVSIMESIQIKKSMVRLVGGDMEVFKLRDEYLPIIRLHEVFDVNNAVHNVEEGLLVVVEGGGKRVGLFVDELLGQQQVVIKSLETNFKKMQGVSGATILGDGSVAIIIDIPGLISLASEQQGSSKAHAIA